MSEPSEEELLQAVKDSLTRDGHLDKFKAELRAAVINVLNNSTGVPNQKPPELPTDTKIMNDLIKEYLEWNGYRYTEQILSAESGTSEKPKRKDLAQKLGVTEDNHHSMKIPLLYFLLASFQKTNNVK